MSGWEWGLLYSWFGSANKKPILFQIFRVCIISSDLSSIILHSLAFKFKFKFNWTNCDSEKEAPAVHHRYELRPAENEVFCTLDLAPNKILFQIFRVCIISSDLSSIILHSLAFKFKFKFNWTNCDSEKEAPAVHHRYELRPAENEVFCTLDLALQIRNPYCFKFSVFVLFQVI